MIDTKVKIKLNFSNHSLNRSKMNARCIVDRSKVCGRICLLGLWTSNLSVDIACLLFIFLFNTTWLYKNTVHYFLRLYFFINSFIFPESLNGTLGIWALLEIRIAELLWNLLFELSPPPLSRGPLTRLISQPNWPPFSVYQQSSGSWMNCKRGRGAAPPLPSAPTQGMDHQSL